MYSSIGSEFSYKEASGVDEVLYSISFAVAEAGEKILCFSVSLAYRKCFSIGKAGETLSQMGNCAIHKI
jgi:hypothetical protein